MRLNRDDCWQRTQEEITFLLVLLFFVTVQNCDFASPPFLHVVPFMYLIHHS